MPGLTKQRSEQIQSAAATIVSLIGIKVIDDLSGDARKSQLITLAKQLQAETGITWNTARQHIAKACRRARGKSVEEAGWGGKRQGAGRHESSTGLVD